jgi:hypothetical protein
MMLRDDCADDADDADDAGRIHTVKEEYWARLRNPRVA